MYQLWLELADIIRCMSTNANPGHLNDLSITVNITYLWHIFNEHYDEFFFTCLLKIEYAKYPDTDENVAVIVCGKHVRFQRYYSNHYEDIKQCLGKEIFRAYNIFFYG